MLIRVMYRDGRQDRVKKAELADLIQSCQIRKFKRFSGWISIICDKTREKEKHALTDYEGRERRKIETINDVFLNEPSDF